jgi:hypothetical protein
MLRLLTAVSMAAERGQVRVLFLQFANPAAYPPIEHAATSLRRAGADVRLFGVAYAETARLRLPPELQSRSRLAPAGPTGAVRRLAWAAWCARAAAVALRWRPDWIYASDPLAAPVAGAIRSLARRGVIYHEHDEPAPGGLPNVLLRARQHLVRNADVVVVPNAARLRRVLGAAGVPGRRHAFVVWNAARADECRPTADRAAAPLRLWYHGSINATRLPSVLLDGVRAARGAVTLDVAGYATPDDGWIEREIEASRHPSGASIRRAGVFDQRVDLLDACAQSHFGVCCYASGGADPNQRDMAGASNKVFDYLARGLGLLVSDDPQWRSLLAGRRDVVFFDPADRDSCAQALRAAAAIAPRLAELRSPVTTWERGFAPVLELLCA